MIYKIEWGDGTVYCTYVSNELEGYTNATQCWGAHSKYVENCCIWGE